MKNIIRFLGFTALVAVMTVSAFAQDAESDFQVTKAADGKSVTITKYVGTKTVVNIPSKIQNLPVTTIGDSAFKNIKTITSVTIPNGVTSIGTNAFQACISLTSVTIPNGITKIGDGAFFQCEKLPNITIPASVTNIGTNAFSTCMNLTRVTFQGTIPSGGFHNDAFSKIGDLRAKFYATDTAKGTAGTYTTTMPAGAGSIWTREATAATAPAQTTQYDPESDFQVTQIANAMTITKYVGTKTTVSIPPDIKKIPVTVIGEQAFAKSNITSITIPIATIGPSAFFNCAKLNNVVLGTNVTAIGAYAFLDCVSLTSVTFQGTKISSSGFDEQAFMDLGDLRAKYLAGGAGTYTRPNTTSQTWTKK